MYKIKNITIKNQLVLAPMAGVSNHPFRVIAKELGAGLVYSEMISDKGIHYNNQKTLDLLYMSEEERPVAIQIFGSNLETMVQAAIFMDQNSNCDIIDINMGCPVPKVAISSQAGASLLKDPKKIYTIVSEIVKKVSKPVTVKIRTGWDETSINAVEVAKIIEKAGASAIAVHGRTRAQGYSGKANLDIIKAVKAAVSIPVIGNGDVTDYASFKHMLDYTGVDAVMIGRAALGNPWIFREIIEAQAGRPISKPSLSEIQNLLLKHFDDLAQFKNERIACLEMRSHGPWYLKGLPHATYVRALLSRCESKLEFYDIVNTYFDQLKKEQEPVKK